MLLRREPERRIAVPQPSHAWVAGQLAAAWGNADFERPAPRDDVILAATLHDIGWAAWERAPTRDPATGWPRQFPQVSPLVHVDLWREGVAALRLFGRYPALLVSRHADTIYSRHFDPKGATAEERAAVRIFLDEQHAMQRDLMASLRSDPLYGALASEEAVERNRLLVAAVDALSLKLCWGVDEPSEVADVPAGPGGNRTVTLRRAGAAVTLSPWPFGAERLRLTVEGKALTEPSPSDEALARALAGAPAVALAFDLVPG